MSYHTKEILAKNTNIETLHCVSLYKLKFVCKVEKPIVFVFFQGVFLMLFKYVCYS